MIHSPDDLAQANQNIDSIHINEYVEAFERFIRNAATPVTERSTYAFTDLQPPYFFPQAITDHANGQPIEAVTVQTASNKPGENTLSVTFLLADNSELQLSRASDAAQLETPFLLTRPSEQEDKDSQLLDTVDPATVGRFLSGLALGPEHRRQLALAEAQGSTQFEIDPQSLVFFGLLGVNLKEKATYSEVTRHYKAPVQARLGSTHDVEIDTTVVSTGHNEYSLRVTGHDTDGDSHTQFGMSLGLSHDYSREQAPSFDVDGTQRTISRLETLDNTPDKATLCAYGLAVLKIITLPDTPTESLRRFWQ